MASKYGQTTLSLILKALIAAEAERTGETPKQIQEAMGDAAGIQRGTVLQILRGDFKTPPKLRLWGFAVTLTTSPEAADYLYKLLVTTTTKAKA